MKFNPLIRTRVVFFLVLIFSLLLIGKLFLVQIVHSESYREKADRQYSTPSSSLFERGSVYFSRKDGQLVSAASQALGYKITINPVKISDKEKTYSVLSSVVDIDQEDFFIKANKTNDPYEEIVGHLSKENADKISAFKMSGVSIFKEKWRFYPGENLASQTLGIVGYKGDDFSGRYGLERQYNDVLSRGKSEPYVNFFAEVFSNINDAFFNDEPKEGDIITTIEPEVQGFLEKVLENVQQKYNVDSMGGIIMNPKDGSIYAMGTKPDFNPNDFSSIKNISLFGNPLVENVYEFGSVIKPLVMASALDAGVIKAETKYEDKGSVIVEDKEIFNFDKKGRGVVDMQEVLTQSLNTGMVYVYKKLGKEKMRDYMFAYGVKEKTGIDLPNEVRGLVSNIISSPRDLEYANASFGQGIALTPVNTIRALASLSNGGNLVMPHVVDKIKYPNGLEKKIEYPITKTKISESTSAEITRMLVNVMDKSTVQGVNSKLEHYNIAMKTGTAQIANIKGGGYYEDRHMHSFVGYLPAYDPQFIVLLYAINPKNVLYAAQTWIDPFLGMARFLVNYYEIAPDR